MEDFEDWKRKSLSVFRSAAEEIEMKREKPGRDNEGGHMSSMSGRVIRRAGADRPYLAVLTHHGSECTEHGFATMREAEAFIKRNTPVPGRTLSALYDRKAGET